MRNLIIETQRLRLVAGTAELTRLAITDKTVFSKSLQAIVPSTWPQELMRDAESWTADILAKDPDSAGWWVWYVVLKIQATEPSDILIGTVGLKGSPQPDGTVEVGYGILDDYQRRGYATEGTLALMDWAWQDSRVTNIVAETYPHLIPSIRTMEKCGMAFVGPGSEEGVVKYGIAKK